jgi:sec-independent protein translocase protein TatB
MFDIGWSELLVIGVVAVIVVGPKELPAMLRTFGQFVAKVKRMAGEFQGQFNEALREAELADVRKSIEEQMADIDPLKDIREPMNQATAEINRGLDVSESTAAAPGETVTEEAGPASVLEGVGAKVDPAASAEAEVEAKPNPPAGSGAA